MIGLPYLTLCRVSGADAGTFLHAQLAADVVSLAVGEARFAALCSARGQVIALLLVLRREEDWLLCGAAVLMTEIVDRLRRFVLRSRVGFDVLAEGLAALPVDHAVPETAAILAPRGTRLRYALTRVPDRAGDVAEWRWEELAQGVLWLEPATSERFIPQMLGLERIGAVSFEKGCYPGQEVIARARYLGQVKRHPVWVEFTAAEPPAAGAGCVLQSEAGTVEAVFAGVAHKPGGTALAVVVTALPDAAQVAAIGMGDLIVPARRLPAPA